MSNLLTRFYALLCALSALAMVSTFLIVMLGIVGRETGLITVGGLDAYAGYAIAAALFLALPETLRRGDHIRVTLLLQRLPQRGRAALELWGAAAGFALSAFLAWYAARLVWISFATHDVSPSSDATPLWLPQLAMALGCAGLAVSMAHALACQLKGRSFFVAAPAGEAAHVE
ncbi:TRAP transporter small permease [Aquabacterium humicola]|uniref:TRAP transporter small permease n=1 Tax=Aquabacterium humicola TaxID=3237377 RepID=UPI0025438136|nr:TRAP transporter small permease [Rubrivivax pictus]